MLRKELSFGDTIVGLMKKHNADKKSIEAYKMKCSEHLGEQFNDLMTQIREFD